MRRGFTLVELLVVVGIAIILIAIALPTIKYQMDETKVRESARQVNAFFASAKAQATATGRPAGVWLELEKIGDPNAVPGVYQCSQLYLAEVPPPYAGDTTSAICLVRQAGPPWDLDFGVQGASLVGLIGVGETFRIQLDFKGHWFTGIRTAAGFQIIPDSSGRLVPNRPPWYGADGAPGTINVDDDGNTVIDDFSEWGMGDDAPKSIYAKYKISRRPQRVGQPLELPQGVVLDMSYGGFGPGYVDKGTNTLIGMELHPSAQVAAGRGIVVLFSPSGSVSEVHPIVNPFTGFVGPDNDLSRLHLLVGRTGNVEFPWVNIRNSNMADGSAFWVSVNRRTGSIATVENTPDVTLPFGTNDEKAAYIHACREFASISDVTGGQ